MKKRIASFLAAIAVLATGAASMGCLWFFIDEPNSLDLDLD